MIIIDIIILIISEILMKKYLKRKMLFPKTRLIKGSGVTNDDLDINNSVFLHMTDGIIAFDRNGICYINKSSSKANDEYIYHKIQLLKIFLETIAYKSRKNNIS